MTKHFFSFQFIGFVSVGLFAALLHWAARIFLSYWLSFSYAVMIAYCVGMIVAFVLNRFFVFPKSNRPISKQARDFTLTNLLFFPVVWLLAIKINNKLFTMGVSIYNEEISHAVAISIPMLATFLIYKFFAFKE